MYINTHINVYTYTHICLSKNSQCRIRKSIQKNPPLVEVQKKSDCVVPNLFDPYTIQVVHSWFREYCCRGGIKMARTKGTDNFCEIISPRQIRETTFFKYQVGYLNKLEQGDMLALWKNSHWEPITPVLKINK